VVGGVLGRVTRRHSSRTPAHELAGPPAGRRVLLLATDGTGGVRSWHRFLTGGATPDQVTVLDPTDRLGERLRALRSADLAVVLTPEAELPSGQPGLFAELVVALPKGARYLLDRQWATDAEQPLAPWLRARKGEQDKHQPAVSSGHVGHAIGRIQETPDAVAVTSRRTHLPVVRDRDITAVLPVREPAASVALLEQRDPVTFPARTQVHTHGYGAGTFPTEYACPRLELREYRTDDPAGIAVSGRGLAYVGSTVLPDSFRWHMGERPFNQRLYPGARPMWGRVPPVHRPRRHLPGVYYHLDSAHAYHFGHLTTEVVSRLWGWEAAKREHPDLKVVLVHWKHYVERPALPVKLFAAYGIDPADVVWSDDPVSVDTLVGATPMWHQVDPYYVHPDLIDTWERLAHGLTDGDPDGGEAHERIFVSRGSGAHNRACRNQEEVEAHFADRGFEIVYPEDHPLPEQVRIFRKARVIAGFGGSGLFNMMYARRLERLIVLNHEAYAARNEHMFSSVLGNEQHYFWSKQDVQRDPGMAYTDVFQSDWEFDFERNRADLDAVLLDC